MKAQDLKKSILQYAMQGKLVPQDPNDKPASELLKRIKAEKEQLIKEGKIKKEKPLPPITQDEIPYDLPQGWQWVRLNCVLNRICAGGDKPKNFTSTKTDTNIYPVIANGEKNNGILGYSNIPIITDRSITVSGRGTMGFTCIREPNYIPIVRLLVLIPNSNIDIKFLKFLLSILTENGTGTAVKQLTVPMLAPKLIPLPPLAEQKRIVEKLEEILPLVDEYGKNEEILSEMNQKLPKQIRQSILQYAVQGKLVEQNPQDEPASELLKRIKAEKEQLIKEGKIKKEKPLPPITQDEILYDLPQGWEWVKLGDLCQINPRNFIPDTTESGFIPMTLIKDGFNNSHSFEIRKWSEIKKGFTHFQNNDIVIAKITPCFQNRKSAIIQNLPNGIGAGTTELHVIRDNTNIINMKYLLLNFKTEYFIQNGIKIFTGTAGQQRIGKEYIANYLIPLPPLAEQKRIVSKVKELMQLVDKLENI